MLRWGLLGIALVATSASAQTVMDGSDRTLNEQQLSRLKTILNETLNDPYGAQLQKLKIVAPDRLCGSINARNSYGGLTGFRHFGADMKEGKLLVAMPDPDIDVEGAKTLEELTAAREVIEKHLIRLKALKAMCTP